MQPFGQSLAILFPFQIYLLTYINIKFIRLYVRFLLLALTLEWILVVYDTPMKFKIEKLTTITSAKEFLANTFEEALEAANSDQSSDWRIIDDSVEYEIVD